MINFNMHLQLLKCDQMPREQMGHVNIIRKYCISKSLSNKATKHISVIIQQYCSEPIAYNNVLQM